MCKPYKAHIDQDNKIVTTAAYMCETAVHEIHDGVAKMVNEVIKLCWCSKTYQRIGNLGIFSYPDPKWTDLSMIYLFQVQMKTKNVEWSLKRNF